MTAWITQSDVQNYGHDLIDFSQRAAAHALGPHLDALGQQNANLQHELARERRHRLDSELERAVPNYREIDQDPAWHRFLLGIHDLSGQVRQQHMNDAIARGDSRAVIALFNAYLSEHAGAGAGPGRAPRARAGGGPSGDRIWSRAEIKRLYDLHQRGKFRGREAEWSRLEAEIIAAGAQGRVLNSITDIAGK